MEVEDMFLNTFFTHISHLCFDKAKEHVDKERERCRNTQLGPWGLLLAQLPQIMLAEKSYYELGFFLNKTKGFLRKDNSLRAVYEGLRVELCRLEEVSRQVKNDTGTGVLCYHLSQFLAARVDMIDFYERVYTMGNTKEVNLPELIRHIDEVIAKHDSSFSHIAFSPVKALFSLECEILSQLLKAANELSSLRFLESLYYIYQVHNKLTTWESSVQSRDLWKLGFLKNNPLPPLLSWLVKFKGTALSKFSLYFYSILSQQTNGSEMKQLCSKLQCDYHQKLISFQKKYDVSYVLLITTREDREEYPVIVSYPPKVGAHIENVLKSISAFKNDPASFDKINFYYSTENQFTYVHTGLDKNVYVVLVFDNKKTERDVFITNFFQETCLHLNFCTVFSSLKGFTK